MLMSINAHQSSPILQAFQRRPLRVVNWTPLHFPPILCMAQDKGPNFQHVRVASWKSNGQSDLDGVALLRPNKWSCPAKQINLRADLQGKRFERDAGCL